MQLVLARHLNKRLIELRHTSRGETVGVLRRDGSYEYVQWLGFVDRAGALQSGKPVKLLVARVGHDHEPHILWRDVPKGRHVQGCLTPHGVYAVA
ncbi:MAG: hypothetical protein AAF513_03355, partial [Pseudomonadota bacterium]